MAAIGGRRINGHFLLEQREGFALKPSFGEHPNQVKAFYLLPFFSQPGLTTVIPYGYCDN